MELTYEIIDIKDEKAKKELKEYYRKSFIYYFELLDPKDIKEANKYKPKKLLKYNKDLTERGIKVNDVSLFYTLIQSKRYNTLGLPKLTKEKTNKISEKYILEVIDEYYKSEYLKAKEHFKSIRKVPQNLPFYFLCFFENNIKDNFIERVKKILSIKGPATKDRMQLLYGEKEGQKRWEEYLQKQKSKECIYKNGNERAVTLENLTQKWGKKLGTRFFNQYCKTQQYVGIDINYFIETYGKEEGTKKFKEMLKAKNHQQFVGKNYSQVSFNLFKQLENYFPNLTFYYGENEVSFYDPQNNRYYFYDCYIPEKHLIIEFNGDLFHANPELFTETDTPNPYNKDLTAKEIWEFDKMKNDFITKNGYNLKIVWEADYHDNPNKIIEDLIKMIEAIKTIKGK